MKPIKIKDIKVGDYICCIWDVEETRWRKSYFKVIEINKKNNNLIWANKWLDILRKGGKEICNRKELIDKSDVDKMGRYKIKSLYKLTQEEFLKETEHDFMLDELGDKNKNNDK